MSTTEIIVETGEHPQVAIIWLHGLGADGYDFAPIVDQLNLPEDVALRFIFPHAPVRPVTINGGYKMRAWYDILGLDRMSQEDDVGMKESEQLIHHFIEQQLQHGISADNIFLAGFSQGGAMALYAGLRYPKTLGGIIALSTYLPLAKKLEHESTIANQATAIFMAHGEFDPVISLEFAEISREALKALDYTVDWHLYPMEHNVCAEEVIALRNWLLKKIK